MSKSRHHAPLFRVVLVIFILLAGVGAVYAKEKAAGKKEPKKEELSAKDLEALVGTLESSEKRDALIRDLEGLIEIQKAQPAIKKAGGEPLKARTPNLIERTLVEYDLVSRKISGLLHNIIPLVRRAPEIFALTAKSFSVQENRARLYRRVAILILGTALAVGIMVLIRRLVAALLRRATSGKEQTAARNAYIAGLKAISSVARYVAIFVGFYLLL